MLRFALRFILVITAFCTGCATIKIAPVQPITYNDLIESELKGEYLVVHFENEIWNIWNLALDSTGISADKGELGFNHRHIVRKTGKSTQSYMVEGRSPNDEVHIYVSRIHVITEKRISFDLESIQLVEVYDPAVAANILAVVGIVGGTWLLTGYLNFMDSWN